MWYEAHWYWELPEWLIEITQLREENDRLCERVEDLEQAIDDMTGEGL